MINVVQVHSASRTRNTVNVTCVVSCQNERERTDTSTLERRREQCDVRHSRDEVRNSLSTLETSRRFRRQFVAENGDCRQKR